MVWRPRPFSSTTTRPNGTLSQRSSTLAEGQAASKGRQQPAVLNHHYILNTTSPRTAAGNGAKPALEERLLPFFELQFLSFFFIPFLPPVVSSPYGALTSLSAFLAQEQKLALQRRSKDSHLNQLGEVEKRFGVLSRQCAAVRQAHEKLEQNGDERTTQQNTQQLGLLLSLLPHSQALKYWDVDTILMFLARNTTSMRMDDDLKQTAKATEEVF